MTKKLEKSNFWWKRNQNFKFQETIFMKRASSFVFSIFLWNSISYCLGTENDSSIDDLKNYSSDNRVQESKKDPQDDKKSQPKFLLGISYEKFLKKFANKSFEEIEEYFDEREKKKENKDDN